MSRWLTIKSRIHKPRRRNEEQYSKPESVVSMECLMEELELHLRHYRELEKIKGNAAAAAAEEEEEENRLNLIPGSRVDYSWLITSPVNSPFSNWQISVKDRTNLEELFSNVKPSQCCEIIKIFRKRLVCATKSAEEMVSLMRTIVEEVITTTPPTLPVTNEKSSTSNVEVTSGSVTRFFRGLKTSSHKIGPQKVNNGSSSSSNNQSEEGEMLFIQRKPLCYPIVSRDHFYVKQIKK